MWSLEDPENDKPTLTMSIEHCTGYLRHSKKTIKTKHINIGKDKIKLFFNSRGHDSLCKNCLNNSKSHCCKLMYQDYKKAITYILFLYGISK